MKRIVALVGVALVGLLAQPAVADAAEPYDSEIASILVAPADPAFVEVLDPAADPHSGLVGEAEVRSIARAVPGGLASVRGGYLRTFRDDSRALVEFGVDLGAVGAAQSRLDDGVDVGGTPLTVEGATGFTLEEGATPDGIPLSAVAFEVGPRLFTVALTGDDPEHAFLYAQMNAVAAAAVARPTDAAPATTVAVGAVPVAPSATTAPASGLAATWSEVVHDERIDEFLGGAAILLVLVLLNRGVNARRRHHVRSAVGQRSNGAGRPGPAVWAPTASAWPTLGNERWPSSAEAPFPTLATPAATAAPAPVNRTADLPMEAYSGERNVGWGDEPDELAASAGAVASAPAPEPLPPLPSRSRTPKVVPPAALLPTTGPTAAPPAAPVAPVAPAPVAPAPVAPVPVAPEPVAPVVPVGAPSPWTVSASLHDEEEYSFPGAETWPGDPVGDGRA